jgi:hypothetical protein
VNVPTKLATPRSANETDMSRHAPAVVRLKRTSVSTNFQYAAGEATSPMSGYAIEAKTNGGTTRSGRMSKKTLAEKYVNDE